MSATDPRLRGLIRRPRAEQLQELARREFLHLTPAEAKEYERILDSVLTAFDHLDIVTPAPPSTPVRRRGAVRRPTPEEDPYNAFVWFCTVEGAEDGPLAGLRVAAKDTIAVAGVPLCNGSRTAPYVPSADSVVIERLLAAGASVVGTLNMDDWSSGGTGETSAFGPPLNPLAPTRSAGGSSGGAGSAVASGAVDIAIGVDQAGSGRIPAAYCGVSALKPTHGLIPTYGLSHTAHNIDAPAPTARRLELLARTLDALAGFDERDPQTEYDVYPRSSAAGEIDRGVNGLRVGVVQESLDGTYCSPEMRAGLDDAARLLREAGASVRPVSCPVWELSWPVAVASLCTIGWETIQTEGQGVGHMGHVDAERVRHFAMSRRLEADDFPPFTKVWLLLGRYLNETYYSVHTARAQNARMLVRQRVSELFDSVDLLLTPTTPTPAPALEHDSRGDFELLERGLNGLNTAIFSLTGHPALATPAGQTPDGLPVSVQLIAAHFQDALTLRAGRVLERALSE